MVIEQTMEFSVGEYNAEPRLERLQKLADHLRTAELGHKTFDFSVYNTICYDPEREPKPEFKPNGCGTNGCAIGELPFIFPDTFHFVKVGLLDNLIEYQVEHRFASHLRNSAVADAFFGILTRESTGLFSFNMTGRQGYHAGYVNAWNTKALRSDSTRYEVAESIENFIAWTKSGDRKKYNDDSEQAERELYFDSIAQLV